MLLGRDPVGGHLAEALAFGLVIVAAAYVIGLVVAFVHIVGIPRTGASVNLARSGGPTLFVSGKALMDIWVFIVGPMAGAALAALTFGAPNAEKKEIEAGGKDVGAKMRRRPFCVAIYVFAPR